MSGEEIGQFRGLAVAEFGEEDSIGNEHRRGVPGEIPIGVQSVHTAVERQAGLVVTDLGLKKGNLSGRDVGRIGHDNIESTPLLLRRAIPEGVGVMESDAVFEPEATGVFPGDFQCGQGQVHGMGVEIRAAAGEGEGKATRTGPEIDGSTGFIGQELQGAKGQGFGLGTRNKDLGDDPQFEVEERGGSDQMLERNPQATPGDQRFKTHPCGGIDGPMVADGAMESGNAGHVLEQPFRLELGVIDTNPSQADGGGGKEIGGIGHVRRSVPWKLGEIQCPCSPPTVEPVPWSLSLGACPQSLSLSPVVEPVPSR